MLAIYVKLSEKNYPVYSCISCAAPGKRYDCWVSVKKPKLPFKAIVVELM